MGTAWKSPRYGLIGNDQSHHLRAISFFYVIFYFSARLDFARLVRRHEYRIPLTGCLAINSKEKRNKGGAGDE
jgi:hypothetical protein